MGEAAVTCGGDCDSSEAFKPTRRLQEEGEFERGAEGTVESGFVSTLVSIFKAVSNNLSWNPSWLVSVWD